jgi:hypothetical protein
VAAVVIARLDLAAIIVTTGVDAARTRVLAAGARVVDAIVTCVIARVVVALRRGCLAGAARVVGVLGLVARAANVLVLVSGVVVTLTRRVVLRRGGALLDGARGGVVVCRIVSTLGSNDNRGHDPEERDSKDECECSTHDHKARAGVVSGFPSPGQGWVKLWQGRAASFGGGR